MRAQLLILPLIIITLTCSSPGPHYEYSDGNANLYTISPTTLGYFPVKPKESSSGLYDGGTPKAVPLTTAQFETLRALLEKAINNPAVHLKERTKMSGVISMIDEYPTKQYILQPGCEELAAIEVFMNVLLGGHNKD